MQVHHLALANTQAVGLYKDFERKGGVVAIVAAVSLMGPGTANRAGRG